MPFTRDDIAVLEAQMFRAIMQHGGEKKDVPEKVIRLISIALLSDNPAVIKALRNLKVVTRLAHGEELAQPRS